MFKVQPTTSAVEPRQIPHTEVCGCLKSSLRGASLIWGKYHTQPTHNYQSSLTFNYTWCGSREPRNCAIMKTFYPDWDFRGILCVSFGGAT
jgi:hypothetical protein